MIYQIFEFKIFFIWFSFIKKNSYIHKKKKNLFKIGF